MTAIGFCGGSPCGLGHRASLREHGAALVIDDMRLLPTSMAELARAPAMTPLTCRSARNPSMPVLGVDGLGRRRECRIGKAPTASATKSHSGVTQKIISRKNIEPTAGYGACFPFPLAPAKVG